MAEEKLLGAECFVAVLLVGFPHTDLAIQNDALV
jgi:hypothetical protein